MNLIWSYFVSCVSIKLTPLVRIYEMFITGGNIGQVLKSNVRGGLHISVCLLCVWGVCECGCVGVWWFRKRSVAIMR